MSADDVPLYDLVPAGAGTRAAPTNQEEQDADTESVPSSEAQGFVASGKAISKSVVPKATFECPYCGFLYFGPPRAQCPDCGQRWEGEMRDHLQFASPAWIR